MSAAVRKDVYLIPSDLNWFCRNHEGTWLPLRPTVITQSRFDRSKQWLSPVLSLPTWHLPISKLKKRGWIVLGGRSSITMRFFVNIMTETAGQHIFFCKNSFLTLHIRRKMFGWLSGIIIKHGVNHDQRYTSLRGCLASCFQVTAPTCKRYFAVSTERDKREWSLLIIHLYFNGFPLTCSVSFLSFISPVAEFRKRTSY